MTRDDAALTQEEKLRAFRRATNSLSGSEQRWADRVRTGLTDEQLADALRYELGPLGGATAENIGVTCQGNGLKVWADRSVGSRSRPPIFEGQDTVSFARRVYGIPDPNHKQMSLL